MRWKRWCLSGLALLVGCQQPAPDPQTTGQVAALETRVAALETQLAELKAAQRENNVDAAGDVTARAAAQNCAIALSRSLELFRQSSLKRRYPTPAQLDLPEACQGQRIGWERLEAQLYAFAVTNGDGQVLVRQRGP